MHNSVIQTLLLALMVLPWAGAKAQSPYETVLAMEITYRYYVEVSVRPMRGISAQLLPREAGAEQLPNRIRLHAQDSIRVMLRDSMNPGKILPFSAGESARVFCAYTKDMAAGKAALPARNGHFVWTGSTFPDLKTGCGNSMAVLLPYSFAGIVIAPEQYLYFNDLSQQTQDAYREFEAIARDELNRRNTWPYPNEVIEHMRASLYFYEILQCGNIYHQYPGIYNGWVVVEFIE